VLVDRAAPAIRMAGENARALGFAERVRLVTADAVAALPRLDGPFHWVFVDPPYASDQAERCLVALGGAQAGLLAEAAVVIVEHDHRRPPAERPGALQRRDLRRWGDTAVSFYQRTDEPP
jgi:16S rRNA (guanine966-N2)-methyltransferase